VSEPGRHTSSRRRRLAFVYHPRSFGTLQIAEAARGVCELIWVVDTPVAGTTEMLPLLRRLGPVVDIAGLMAQDGAAAIARERPDGILALKDSLMRRTAQLAEQLGLPFHDLAVAQRFTDKHAQRRALRDAGVPVPGFWEVPEPADDAGWVRLATEAVFPAVLKPRHNSEGSRDTMRVATLDEVRAQAGGAALLLEEYLGDREHGIAPPFADYVSVESVVSVGRVQHVAITGRFPPAPPFRESGFFIDAALTDTDRRAALEVATAAVRALGVTIGCLHTEIKFTPAGPRVIELNGRIGGGVPEMLRDAGSQIELLGLAMRLAIGEPAVFTDRARCERVAFLFYVHAPDTMSRITGVEGLKRLSADPAVTEVILNRGPGRVVDWREGNHGHVFSVRGAVADHDMLIEMARRIEAEVTITGEHGREPVPDTATMRVSAG
jgi:biotin carboxylase